MDTKQAVLDQRSEVSAYVHFNGWVYYIECSPTDDLISRWRECDCVDKLLCPCSDEELQGETHRFGSFDCEADREGE